jgi:Tfp pilus assembly protein PilF
MLRKCGRVDEAEAEFDAALALDPGNVAAVLEKARLLAESGRGEEARRVMDGARAAAGRDPGWAMLRAEIAADDADAAFWYTEALIAGHPLTDQLAKIMRRYLDRIVADVLEETRE